MRTATSIRNLVGLLALSTFSIAQGVKPTPAATLDLPALLAPGSATVALPTIAFLTDHSLAVAGCNERKQCKLVVLRLADGKLEPAAETDTFAAYASIHRSGEGVLADRNGDDYHAATLYSPDLKNAGVISRKVVFDNQISFTGSTFGQSMDEAWTIYKASSPTTPLRSGRGTLLSLSDKAVVYQWRKQVSVETMDGKLLGSFLTKNRSKCWTGAQIIDKNRLVVSGCGKHSHVTDLNGKLLAALPEPPGCCGRFDVSSDGNRVLYATFTRHVSIGQQIYEAVVGVASLGMAIGDEEFDGESVRVVDTQQGKSCFQWSGPMKSKIASDYYADISPSGREVAIVTDTTLLLYELPAECSGH